MTLDNEQQRTQILELIENATFRGTGVDVIYNLKQAVKNAEVKEPNADHS